MKKDKLYHRVTLLVGHVYLMVPSASSLFGNPDTLISPSIQGDNAASSPLVQVLTVPASTSPALIEHQVGHFLTPFIHQSPE